MGDGVKGIASDASGEGGQIAKDVVKSLASIATGVGGSLKGDKPKTPEEIQALRDAEQAKSQAQTIALRKRMTALTVSKPKTVPQNQVQPSLAGPKQLPQLERKSPSGLPISAKRQWAEMRGNKGSG